MERHWLDAEQLFHLTPPRLANADQLYGLSAECGLKALMHKWGMELNNNKPRRAELRIASMLMASGRATRPTGRDASPPSHSQLIPLKNGVFIIAMPTAFTFNRLSLMAT